MKNFIFSLAMLAIQVMPHPGPDKAPVRQNVADIVVDSSEAFSIADTEYTIACHVVDIPPLPVFEKEIDSVITGGIPDGLPDSAIMVIGNDTVKMRILPPPPLIIMDIPEPNFNDKNGIRDSLVFQQPEFEIIATSCPLGTTYYDESFERNPPEIQAINQAIFFK